MQEKLRAFGLVVLGFILLFSTSSQRILAYGQSGEGGSCRGTPECQEDLICVDGHCKKQSEESQLSETKDVDIELGQYFTLSDGQPVGEVFSKPSDLVNLIVRLVFVVVGLILFVIIVIAGFSMLLSSDSSNTEKTKTTMTNAVLGLLIVLAAYWIMQLINRLTGANIGF